MIKADDITKAVLFSDSDLLLWNRPYLMLNLLHSHSFLRWRVASDSVRPWRYSDMNVQWTNLGKMMRSLSARLDQFVWLLRMWCFETSVRRRRRWRSKHHFWRLCSILRPSTWQTRLSQTIAFSWGWLRGRQQQIPIGSIEWQYGRGRQVEIRRACSSVCRWNVWYSWYILVSCRGPRECHASLGNRDRVRGDFFDGSVHVPTA